MFVAVLSFTLVPLVALALWHDTFAAMLAFGLLLGVSGASFAIGVPFVSRWYPDDRQGFAKFDESFQVFALLGGQQTISISVHQGL